MNQFRISKALFFLPIILVLNSFGVHSQTVLNADGPGNTYELINSVFAAAATAVEAPDQTSFGNHTAFGRHIDEVWDAELNKYVFRFFSHAVSFVDNEPVAGLTDRQRVEIKTYAASPDNLKGTLGETITYKWRFKIPNGFMPSSNFTHIHQIKAVDGDDSNPIFTLTLRKGTPNKLELIYVENAVSGTNKLEIVNLSLFEGVWVEATETIKVGQAGTYNMSIKRLSDGLILLAYNNTNIQTIRAAGLLSDTINYAANSFIRPKWGIYRSLSTLADLRDEVVLFSDFSISEVALALNEFTDSNNSFQLKTSVITDFLEIITTDSFEKVYTIYDISGKKVVDFKAIKDQKINLSNLNSGLYFLKNSEGKSLKFFKL